MGVCILKGAGGYGVDCDNATATAADVYDGLTFGGASSDELIEGTMQDVSANHTLTLNETYTIPAGYHDGAHKVTQNLTYVGAQTGSLPINGEIGFTPGYHNGSGKITQSITTFSGGTYYPGTSSQTVSTSGKYLTGAIVVPAEVDLIPGNILKGKSIFGVTGTLVNQAATHTVYDGSTFYGAFASGVITGMSYYKKTGSNQGVQNWYGINRTTSSSDDTYITSGSITGSKTIQARATKTDASNLGFVSAKTVNFSLYSTVQIGATFTCNNVNLVENPTAYVHLITTTKTGTYYYTQSVASVSAQTYFDSTSVTATLSVDVSGLTGWGFMGINFDATSGDIQPGTLGVTVNSIRVVV